MPTSRRRWLPDNMASTGDVDDHGETARLIGDEQDRASLDDDYNLRKKSARYSRRNILLIIVYAGIGFFAVLLVAAMYVAASLSTLCCSLLKKIKICNLPIFVLSSLPYLGLPQRPFGLHMPSRSLPEVGPILPLLPRPIFHRP